jgi:hypothetical protein
MRISVEVVRSELQKQEIPEETIDAFIESFLANKSVWAQFEIYTLAAIESGKKVGAKAIMERVRWESEVERCEEFKVSNNWTAYYARVFAIKYPHHRNYFEFKQVKGVTV